MNVLKINSVAEFKRSLKAGSTKVHTIYHKVFAGRDGEGKAIYKDEDKGIRTVSIVQSNSFALSTEKKVGTETKMVDSWCNYPKAAQVKFNDSGSITILEEDRDKNLSPVLTYSILKND